MRGTGPAGRLPATLDRRRGAGIPEVTALGAAARDTASVAARGSARRAGPVLVPQTQTQTPTPTPLLPDLHLGMGGDEVVGDCVEDPAQRGEVVDRAEVDQV